jgi:hypothetical protein
MAARTETGKRKGYQNRDDLGKCYDNRRAQSGLDDWVWRSLNVTYVSNTLGKLLVFATLL